MKLVTLLVLALLKGGPAMAIDSQQPVEPIGLATAFSEYLQAVPKKDAAKIPEEFRKDLLIFVEGIGATGDQNVGGWELNRLTVPWTLTRWHKISDHRRVAAIFEVRQAKKKWLFENLKFMTARTEPSH